jgi:hypothetical protein
MRFKLKIVTGNDAMDTPEDVADALRAVARTIQTVREIDDLGGAIFDGNGNRVGNYEVDTLDEGIHEGGKL